MSSKPVFYIYDHWLMPTPYNHRFFVEKYAQGFIGHGFEVKLVKSLSQIQGKGIIMISSHHVLHGYDRGETPKIIKLFLGGLLWLSTKKVGGKKIFGRIERIANWIKYQHLHFFLKRIKQKPFVITTRFTHKEEAIFHKHNAKVIYSGDHYYIKPSDSGKEWYVFYQSYDNALPVKFSANIDPSMEHEVSHWDKKIDVGFVGSKQYKKERYEYFASQENTEIYGTPPYISEEKRIHIYRHSKIILGFHSDANIANGNVTERVFEALAYGAVCVTDNPSAKIATDDSVIVVYTKEECIQEVNKLLTDSEYYESYRKKGLAFAYSRGLYYHRAGDLLDRIKKIYNISFIP